MLFVRKINENSLAFCSKLRKDKEQKPSFLQLNNRLINTEGEEKGKKTKGTLQ